MQCLRCGAALEEGFQVCKKCGYPVKKVDNDTDIKIERVINEEKIDIQPVVAQQQTTSVFVEKDNTTNMVVNNNTSITNSDYEIFGPENNDYNDINIMSNDNIENIDDDYSESNISKYKYFIVTGFAAFIVIIALLCVKFIPVDEGKKLEDNPVDNIVTYNKIVFKNYIFNIPDKYVYSVGNDALTIGDSDGNYGIQIEVSSGNYSKLSSNKTEIKKILEKKGYTSTDCEYKNENGIEFLVTEVGNEQKVLLAITKANSTNYFTIALFNKNNEIDYDLLKKVAEFIKLTEEVKSSNKLNSKNLYGMEFENIAK